MMKKNDLVLCKDDSGAEYFTLSTDFITKNHQNDTSALTPGRIQDSHQVFSIKMYLGKLNPVCDRLFQRPNVDQTGQQPWYFNAPIGKNKMDSMLKDIMRESRHKTSLTPTIVYVQLL
eukprot:scpid78579/ scgid25336/ 